MTKGAIFAQDLPLEKARDFFGPELSSLSKKCNIITKYL